MQCLSHQVVVVSMSSHYSIMMCKSEIDFTERLDSVVSTRTQSVCSVDFSHQVVVVSMSSHYSIMMCKSEIDFTELG